MSYADLVQGNIAQFLPYNMYKPLEEVQKEMQLKEIYRFHSLESPFGVSKKVTKVLNDYVKGVSSRNTYPKINLYPDSSCYALKNKLFTIKDYAINNIVVGGDSQELSSHVLTTFLQPGMTVVMPSLSSFEIEQYLMMKGIRLVLTPISEDWSPNFDVMAETVAQEQARLVYIANPSIPIGGFAVKERFRSFLKKLDQEKTIVVVNEEYTDYLGKGYTDMYPLIQEFPNLVLIRSFSHAFGLTDMRIGYLLATEEIASILNVLHMPFQVSQLAQDCACAALDDLSFFHKVIYDINIERNRVREFCTFFSLRMIDTITNSVTITLGASSDRIYHELQKQGIFVRTLGHFGLNDLFNITLGKSHQTDHFLLQFEKGLIEHYDINLFHDLEKLQEAEQTESSSVKAKAYAQGIAPVAISTAKDSSEPTNKQTDTPTSEPNAEQTNKEVYDDEAFDLDAAAAAMNFKS